MIPVLDILFGVTSGDILNALLITGVVGVVGMVVGQGWRVVSTGFTERLGNSLNSGLRTELVSKIDDIQDDVRDIKNNGHETRRQLNNLDQRVASLEHPQPQGVA